MGPVPAEEVKIVIWDLDDTFWRGTLAEDGQVEPVARNIERVRQLAARGIVSSACSKNDEHAALAALSSMGVRDHFVFVAIGWSPKGAAVVSLLQRAGLRPANALFVDDHPSNRAEVASAAAGVRVLSPEEFSATDVSVWGAPDPQRTRLQQYRQLEARSAARDAGYGGDNVAFLRDSRIVAVAQPFDTRAVDEAADRVASLLNRSNQLNLTQSRMTAGAAQLAWAARGFDAAYAVHVTDQYGDHGLCGFAALRGRRLLHFCCSCRVLGMGLPEAMLAWLETRHGRLRCSFDAEGLRAPPRADWVSVRLGQRSTVAAAGSGEGSERLKLLNLLFCTGHALAAFLPEVVLLQPCLPMAPPTAQLYTALPFAPLLWLAARLSEPCPVAWVAVDPTPTSALLGGLSPMFVRTIAAKLWSGGAVQGQPVPRLRPASVLLSLWLRIVLRLCPPADEQTASLRRLARLLPAGTRLVVMPLREDLRGLQARSTPSCTRPPRTSRDPAPALQALIDDADSPFHYLGEPAGVVAEMARRSNEAARRAAASPPLRGVVFVPDLAEVERGFVPSGVGHYPRQFYAEAAAVIAPLLPPPAARVGLARRRSEGSLRALTAAFAAACACIAYLACAPPRRLLAPEGSRVVGVGFGRSGAANAECTPARASSSRERSSTCAVGTNSLKQALDRLGFVTYHADQITYRQMLRWAEAERARVNGTALRKEAAADDAADAVVRAGYTATTDFPAANAYRAFLRRWPRARVVWTARDPRHWAKSFVSTLGRALPVLRAWPFSLVPEAATSTEYCYRGAGIRLDAAGRPVSAAQAARAMQSRAAEIRRAVPRGRLLELDVAHPDAWGQLCAFLEVPRADCPVGEPFPRSWLTSRRNLELVARAGELLTGALSACPCA